MSPPPMDMKFCSLCGGPYNWNDPGRHVCEPRQAKRCHLTVRASGFARLVIVAARIVFCTRRSSVASDPPRPRKENTGMEDTIVNWRAVTVAGVAILAMVPVAASHWLHHALRAIPFRWAAGLVAVVSGTLAVLVYNAACRWLR